MPNNKAVVVGVGAEQGLGAALCRRFAADGHHVLVAGRTAEKVEQVAATIRRQGGHATAIAMDATSEQDVMALFDRAMQADADSGPADVVVSNSGSNRRMDFRELSAEQFESMWRQACFGGFLMGREAARRLVPLGRGTVIFTGASSSLRGKPGFAHFSAAKAGLRMIAQAMAREFGPQGLHVAHVVIDGGINGDIVRRNFPHIAAERGSDGLLDVETIAETYWQIHQQPRTAWTLEVDLRPYKEQF
jgi:NAD(P)-dependent dehydrogenase (short-subunit alcohol dehydrogenase family)